MKLRVRNNSLRLRLTQSEVAQFKESGYVEEKVEFDATGENCLRYALVSADVSEISSTIQGHKITIHIPKAQGRKWADSNLVGLENDQDIGGGKMLRILVEKDFTCLERRDGEDDGDTFPHPGAISQAE
jgi:hypothetical protein